MLIRFNYLSKETITCINTYTCNKSMYLTLYTYKIICITSFNQSFKNLSDNRGYYSFALALASFAKKCSKNATDIPIRVYISAYKYILHKQEYLAINR